MSIWADIWADIWGPIWAGGAAPSSGQAWRDGVWAAGAWAEGAWTQAGDVPVITTLEPANGAVNVAYTFTFQATGDVPITWDVSVGSVPAGLTLASTGVLSGTPSGTGTTAFTVRATNAQGTDTLACSLVVGTAATGSGTDRATRSRTAGRGLLRLVGR